MVKYRITNNRIDMIGIYDSNNNLYQLKPNTFCVMDSFPVFCAGISLEKEIDGKFIVCDYKEESIKKQKEITTIKNKKLAEKEKIIFQEKKKTLREVALELEKKKIPKPPVEVKAVKKK